MKMRWFWILTGGRPMRRIGHAFVDVVSGKDVHYFVDRLGQTWMAEGAWSLFRVRTSVKRA